MSKVPKRFDPAILDEMTEPISLRVERRLNNTTTPIELPPEEGQEAGGVGLSRDKIRTIESWLVSTWAGGGFYTFIASDSSEPKKKMEWVASYDTRTYPPRTPPAMIPATTAPPLPPPTVISMTPTPPSAPALPAPAVPPALPPPPQPFSQVPMSSWPTPSFMPSPAPASTPPTAPAFYYPTPGQAPDLARSRELERQNAELQQRAAMLEKQALDEKHAREMERLQRENDAKLEALKISLAPRQDAAIEQRFSKLESVLEKIVDRLTTPPAAPPGPSPELLEMRAANQRLQERLDREQEQRDQDRREQQLRAEVASVQAAMAAAQAAQQQKLDALMAELRNRPQMDPTTEFMKQMLMSLQNQMERRESQQMTPMQIAQLIRESSGGVDEVRKTMSSTFTDIFSFQKQVLENALQLQPQGESPTVRMIEQGLGRVGELAGRFLENRSAEQLAHEKTQRALIEAQAKVLQPVVPAVAAAPVTVNADLAAQAAAQAQAAQAAAAQASGLGGAPTPAAAPPAATVAPAAAAPSNVIPIREAKAAAPTPPKRTDEEWFGPVLPHVVELRQHVHAYLQAVTMGEEGIDPKTKQPHGVAPAQTAGMIMMATGQIIQSLNTQQIQPTQVPAFTDLLLQERFADFLDVLLPPPVPQTYRDETMQALEPLWERATSGEADDGDKDDDKDDDDDKDKQKSS